MLHCIHCRESIYARRGICGLPDDYAHHATNSPYCDAPSMEKAVENGLRRAAPQARPDLKEVTLRNIRELAPIKNTLGDLNGYDRDRDDAYGAKLDGLDE